MSCTICLARCQYLQNKIETEMDILIIYVQTDRRSSAIHSTFPYPHPKTTIRMFIFKAVYRPS